METQAQLLASNGNEAAAPERLPVGALLALATAVFITSLTETLPAGVLPAMGSDLGVNESAIGQTVTIYAIGTALTAIALAKATSRWRRRPLLLFTMSIFAAANTVTAISDQFAITIIARFFAGVAAGLAWAMLAGYARRMVAAPLRGKAIALVMAGIPVALALGVPAGTYIGDVLDWRSAFLAMTALTIVLLIWIALFVPDFVGTEAGAGTSLRSTLKIPGVTPVLAVTLLFVLAHTILYTYIATYLDDIGLGKSVDLVLLAFGAASLLAIWGTGLLIHLRLRLLSIASTAFVIGAVGALALFHEQPILVYAAVAMWGLGWGGIPTLLQTAVADAAKHAADTAQAVLVTLWNVAMALGGIIGGVLLAGLDTMALPWSVIAILVPTLAIVAAAYSGFPNKSKALGRL
ncbi:MAG: MFS transporter [Corynebacteriales bacterium]|nr:MFS transporter [Mycobacteriales bacterium]